MTQFAVAPPPPLTRALDIISREKPHRQMAGDLNGEEKSDALYSLLVTGRHQQSQQVLCSSFILSSSVTGIAIN
jgi:hypothetical protein